MKIAVSACLLGVNCKYSGGNNRNDELIALLRGHTVIPVCPEQLGGLPTPRTPAEIVNGVVMNAAGACVDSEFRAGAEKALALIRAEGAELVILQSRSPSCGADRVYDGTFSGRTIPGMGLFAAWAAENGFRILDVEKIEEIRKTLRTDEANE